MIIAVCSIIKLLSGVLYCRPLSRPLGVDKTHRASVPELSQFAILRNEESLEMLRSSA